MRSNCALSEMECGSSTKGQAFRHGMNSRKPAEVPAGVMESNLASVDMCGGIIESLTQN